MNFVSLPGSRHRWLRRGSMAPQMQDECLLEAVPAGETICWTDAVERLVSIFFDRDGREACFGPAVFAFPDLVIAYRVQADILLQRAVHRGVLTEAEQPAAPVSDADLHAGARVKCTARDALGHIAAIIHRRSRRCDCRLERETAEILERMGWPPQ